MLFAEKPGKFSAFALLYSKIVTEISSKKVLKVTTVPKTVHFLKVSMVPMTVLKKYRVTVLPKSGPTYVKASWGQFGPTLSAKEQL